MSLKDFAKVQYVKTIDTSEVIKIGSFKDISNGELAHIRLLFYIKGLLSGTEKFRTKVYSDAGFTQLLYTSSWSDFSTASVGNWLGWIRSDFARENINKNLTYYVSCELTGYTRNADTFYIGVARDWPWPIYDNSENLFYNHPYAMQLFTYKT